jgi:TolB-like protein/DNA-binding winged helix-turn-helix (wHTH) protein
MSDTSQIPLRFGDFRIDPRKRVLARIDGELIPLTPKHFDTLLYLVENAGEVLDKGAMMAAIWPGMIVEENNLNQAISHLRRILGDDGAEHRYILTVPRRGYRFVADVVAVDDAGSAASETIEPESRIDAPAGNRRIRSATRRWLQGAIAAGLLAGAVAIIVVWRMPTMDSGAGNRKSIAVLPFVNFSGAKEDEFFSEGITEDLVTQLAQISDLKVISRTSILEYKDSKKQLRDIARELGVTHILQGSVRRGETRFRINAQLIDPAKEGHLWAKSYDREIKDVLAVQSEVTAEIAGALKSRLLEPERQLLEKRARNNPDAYVLYRKGIFLISLHPDRTREEWQRAREYFERVIELDPASPLGYAGLARFHFRSAMWGDAARDRAFALAETLAKKALAADERSVEANLVLAAIHSQVYWDWEKAEPFAKRAVELNPGDAEVWSGYAASVLMPTGRLEEALVAQRRAVVLDPLNVPMAQTLASILMYLNRCDEASEQARINLELDSKFRFQHVVLARCHERNRRFREALAAWRIVKRPWLPDHVLDELQALVESPAAQADPAVYWRARFAWSRKYGETAPNQHYFTAVCAAQAGEIDEAFRYLKRSIDLRERDVVALKVDPQFDPLRKDPRFTLALGRLNLK